MKTCSKCDLSKPPSAFNAYARSKDGLTAWCAVCHSEASRAHYLKNKDRLNAKARAWALANPCKARAARKKFHDANKDERSAQHKEWASKNRAARCATGAKRKAVKLNATPPWADHAAIKAIYAEAAKAQKITGVRMSVDHIVPLQSEIVCGLHCESNLQVIPLVENCAKKNYWWPDMPGIEQAVSQGQLFAPAPMKQEQVGLFGEVL